MEIVMHEGINLRHGHDNDMGQMSTEERRAIFDTIRQYKPQTVFDIGTWKGLGSTYIVAEALFKNQSGVCYRPVTPTITINPVYNYISCYTVKIDCPI